MRLWQWLRGAVRIVATNTQWAETQEQRLRRLELDREALQSDVAAIRLDYERRRLRGISQ